MMPSKLCTLCSTIPLTTNKKFRPHHPSAGALLSSASAGCSLCTHLCDALHNTEWPPGTAFGKDAVKFIFNIQNTYSTANAIPTLSFVGEFLERERRGKRMEVYVPVMILPGDGSGGGGSEASTSTGSEESWKVATKWLEKCINEHSTCIQQAQPRRLPTRLLDIGTSGSPSIHLHITDGTPSTTAYVTLSHCWGSVDIKKLEQETLEDFKKDIPVTILPRTFRDAISITRRLGIRYLWIDSLCIIQNSDDGEDWDRESAIMGSVYKNGLCNIAATAASNGTKGCYLNRDPLLARPCQVEFPKGMKRCGLKEGVYDLVPMKLWEQGLSEAPLLKRAWVVQERVLAQRVLHFGQNQLFWECNELDACEMYPNGAPSALAESKSKGLVTGGHEYGFRNLHFKNLDPASVRSEVQIMKTPYTYSFIVPLPSGPEVDSYYVWNKIVLAYTRCGITKDTDRLVAISAMAKQIQIKTKDVYLAGIWRRYLPYHLMWHADQHAQGRERTKQYVAPSWSWASVRAPIEPYVYLRPDNPTMIQILSTGVTPLTTNTMGQVSTGSIKLRGWIRKIRFANRQTKGGEKEIPRCLQFDESSADNESEVWFLPVLSLGPWIAYQALGLLLERTGRKDEFRRVGRFTATEDFATKFFRMPTYPIEAKIRHEKVGTGMLKDETQTNDMNNGKRRWFGKRKMTDDANTWKEQVITII